MNKTLLKIIALLLSFLIVLPDMPISPESALNTFYKNAVDSYEKGKYEDALFHLDTCLELVPAEKPVFKAKILLILAASYTKLGNIEKSEQTLILLRQHIKKKKLGGIPSIYLTDSEGFVVELNPFKLSGYKTVFKDKKYRVKRLIEKKGVKKAKKSEKRLVKMIGIAIIVIIIAIAIFKKKKVEVEEEPYREVEWVTIPAGEFEMGDDKNIGLPDERPLHKVYLDEYAISKYEITFEQYDKFCDETGREKPSPELYGLYKSLSRGKFPVINIIRNEANAYCDWLSQKLGRNVHLPTEAQWEKAARGTDKRTYPWGNQLPTSTLTNWLPAARDGSHTPHVVGSHPDGNSPYGVCDMAGNVWEYCSDWYDANYYSISPYKNPLGPLNGPWRIIRGGSYRKIEGPCRSTYRSGNNYEFYLSIKYSSIGFRPVMEL